MHPSLRHRAFIRSVNLTDQAWQWLATVAEQVGISRNDYLETLAEGNSPLMETVKSQAQPLMETVDTEREVDDVNIEKQPDTELYPFIETVLTEVESLKLELEAVRAQNQLLQIELGNFEVKVETLNQELAFVREQLETERADREENKKSAAAEKNLPSAADLLNTAVPAVMRYTKVIAKILFLNENLFNRSTRKNSGSTSCGKHIH